jgi:hypothetical protein
MMGSMMRRAMIGDSATLNVDFTSMTNGGQLANAGFTFTNATTTARTYINASGIVATATTNEPRFDYTGGSARGLLLEGTATNLLQQSADWTVSPWSKPAQITWDGTTYATAPDGTNTAKQITVTGGSSASVAQGIANATNRTVSLWLRAGSLTTFSVGAFDSSGGTTWGNNADSTCSIISGPGSVTQQVGGLWSITGLSTTQWTRVQVFRSSSYGALLVYPGGAGTVTGTGFMWGMQMEAGNGASSLIPTGASQVQRLADSCVMTGTNFSSWFAGATEGVLFTEFEKPRSQSGTIGHDHAAVGSRYASGSSFIIYSVGSLYYPTTLLWPTGGAIFPGGIASAIPSVSKQAGKWFGGNDATNFANGVQGTTTAGTGTLTPTMLSVGANSTTGTEATRDWLNSCVRRVKFWPVALPDSQIIALTT